MAALPPRPDSLAVPAAAPAPVAKPSPPLGPVAAPATAIAQQPEPTRLPKPAPEAPAEPSVVLEPVYSVLGHGRLATEMLTLARDEELFQWALGGSSDPSHPGSRPGYHPATRVVVDVALLSRAPKGTTNKLLRVARSKGYWGFRACFEAAQRITPKSERVTKVRLTLSAAGRVLGSRIVGPAPERDFARCVLDKARKLDFSPGPSRKLDVEISVKQWPGHAPVPPRAPEGTVLPVLTRTAQDTLQGLRGALQSCYQAGLAADPKLWGRLAFKLTLSSDGSCQDAVEVETLFPDRQVAECARRALLSARFGEGSTTELSLAMRFGQPPAPPSAGPAPENEGSEGAPAAPAPP